MPHNSEALERYRALEADLRLIRAAQRPSGSLGSRAEDLILEEMASLWWLLLEEEREMLDREGTTCDPAVMLDRRLLS